MFACSGDHRKIKLREENRNVCEGMVHLIVYGDAKIVKLNGTLLVFFVKLNGTYSITVAPYCTYISFTVLV